MTQSTFLTDYCAIFGVIFGRPSGLMVGVLDSGSGGLSSSPGQGHFVVFLGRSLYYHSVSLHPGV